ncbi:MAG: translocation/assembly module TamB domain-containing protein [Acidobacteria bacterium]|nr:translocation/assembly module TamB domain-containing protein [Acidobacteriota bacterium]
MKRSWKRLIFLIPAAAALILLLSLSLLHAPPVQRFVFERLRAVLLKRSAIDIQASRFRFNLFRRDIALDDLTVRSASAPTLPPLFHAKSIHARLNARQIMDGLWSLEELDIAAPKIHYYVRPDGQSNLPKTGPRSGRTPEYLIGRGEIRDAIFRYEDLRKETVLELPQWHLFLDGKQPTREHGIRFYTSGPSSLKYRSRTIPIDHLKLSGVLHQASLRIEAADLAAANSQLLLKGTIGDFSSPVLNLQLEPKLDLEAIGRAAQSNKPILGFLAGTIQADGKLSNLKIDAQIKGTNITALNYRDTQFDLKSRAEWDSGRLRIHEMRIDSPQGSVQGTAELFSGPDQKASRIEARLRDFDLFPVWKLLKPPFDLASRVTGTVGLRWNGSFSPMKFAGSARLNLAATRATPDTYVLPLSGTLDAQLRPGQISGNLQPVAALGAHISGPFSLKSFREIEGNFSGSAPDLQILIAQVSRFLGGDDDPLGAMRLSGPLQFHAQAGGTLARPAIAVRAEAPELQSGVLKHLSAKTDAMVDGSQISFQSTITLPHRSSLYAKGAFELGGRDPSLVLDAYGNHIPAAAVTAMLDSKIPTAGDLNAELHLNGPLENLAGQASVSGEELSLYGEPLGHLDIGLLLKGKEVRSTQARLLKNPQKPDSDRLDADLAYSFDTDQFRFQVTGRDLEWKKLALQDGSPIQAGMNLTASGSGSADQPSIDLKIDVPDIRLKQTLLGPGRLSAALNNERISVEAEVPRLNMKLTAKAADEKPYSFDGELQIGDADLSLLNIKAANKQPLTGTLGASLRGSGNLSEFDQSHFSAEIRTLQMRAGEQELHIQNAVHAECRNRLLEIRPAILVSGKSKLELSGTMPLQHPAPSGAFSLKGQIDLAQTTGFILAPRGFAAEGTMNLDLLLGGTYKNVIAGGSIQMNGGTVTFNGIETPLTGVNIRANVQGDSVILQQADAAWGQGRIALTGEFPFGLLPKNMPVQFPRKEGPARFSLDMTKLRPEETGKLPRGVSGLISLHAEAHASSTNLQALKAQIDFSELSFKMNELSIAQNQPSTILVSNGVAEISRLSFRGTETGLDISGSAGFTSDSPLNLRLNGNLNAALFTFMNRDLKASGRSSIQVAVSGTPRAPALSGVVEMNGGKLSLRNPRVLADSLTVRLKIDPKQISIENFKGTLNGGPMTLTGTAGYGRRGLEDVNLNMSVQDFFIDFPQGLKSSSTGNLTITSSEDAILVNGNVRVQESSYREPFELGSQLMSYLKGQQIIIEGRESDVLLDRVRLNIALRTETPVLVQNNIAKVEASGNLRLVGPFNEPSMVGRINLSDGGEIILNQRTYYINRGVITLANETQIEPVLDIQAQTRVSDHEITMRIAGTMERLTTTLTSEPPRSEQDILSLLLTGKVASESSGRGVQMARTQALTLLAGQAGEQLTGEARQALRLSTFRIDPGEIASESDPGARLTVGQDVTNNLSLIYSMNLTNGGDQIWAAQYEIIRRLTTQATKQQDNSYRFEFQHSLLLGGRSGERRIRTSSQRFEIGAIRFEGESPFSDKTLLKNFDVKAGQKYEFPRVQKGLDRLQNFHFQENRLEANIRMQRETQGQTVDLNLNIEAGPVVTFSFEGAPIPSSVKEEVKKAWASGVFDTERTETAVRAIRIPLLQAGYLQSEVTCKIESENDQKLVRFQITSGERYTEVPIVFRGAGEISASELGNALGMANLRLDVYADPQKVMDFLSRYYRERGYLQARISPPSPQLDPTTRTGSVLIQVQEGPLFTIGDLEFSGHRAFTYDELWSVIPTSSGSSYDPNTLRDAVKALENIYRSKGYNDVSVTFRVVQDSAAAHADLTFYIVERRQSVIRDIVIEGTQGTSPGFVQRQLDFQVGDPLDYGRIDETRKRLYSTAVYSSVDFQVEDLSAKNADTKTKDVRIQVRVREIRPYRLQYGLFYDTDRGMGGILEAENRNFLGQASDLGLKLRYDTNLKEGRLFFYQPFVTKIHLKTDVSAFFQRETRKAFEANRIGFSLFQEKTLPKSYRMDYGYRYDHVRWEGLPPDPTIFQASVPVARLVGTLTRDTRDSILDATRGEFSSHSLEFGPSWLGSEIGFTRYYGQYFRYVPLDKFLMKPTKEKQKQTAPARLVYAGALRLGLTSAFNRKEVISPERFFAGGGTTLRGFDQDMLGPLQTLEDGTKRPLGGEALLLFNNEIRFPIFGILHGVAFLDVGNVYPRISDFNFNIRKSAGAGLRIKVKYIPLRFDYGFKLDRKPGESRGAFFFSIGQAF